MASESLSNIALALGLVLEGALQTSLSVLPFGSLLQEAASLAFRLSEKLEQFQEANERAASVKKRCIMISTILISHCQSLSGCDFILNDLILTLQSM